MFFKSNRADVSVSSIWQHNRFRHHDRMTWQESCVTLTMVMIM